MNKKFKYNLILFLYLFTITTIETLLFFIYDYIRYSPISPSIEKITINKSKIKIALISDIHICPYIFVNKNYKTYSKNFKQALKVLKKQNVDIIIIAGDIGDGNLLGSYIQYNYILNSVYSNKKPIMNLIMGNHDYYGIPKPNKLSQRIFEFFTKEKPFNHKIINGFHFINWSPDNGDLSKDKTYSAKKNWAEEQIKIALNDNPSKPIFIITHTGPIFTSYGTYEYNNGNFYLKTLFNNYENIISISGHSHASLMEETSIYQGYFTGIQTQSVSYIELENGYINGRIPVDENDSNLSSMSNPMGIIMELSNEEIIFRRIHLKNGNFYNKIWNCKIPIKRNNFQYLFSKRMREYNSPIWYEKTKINCTYHINKGKFETKITFKQAYHELFVHTYLILFNNIQNGKKIYYAFYSDFYKMKSEWKKLITLKIPINIRSGFYNISIIAIDSFDNESEELKGNIEVKNDKFNQSDI